MQRVPSTLVVRKTLFTFKLTGAVRAFVGSSNYVRNFVVLTDIVEFLKISSTKLALVLLQTKMTLHVFPTALCTNNVAYKLSFTSK
jgi:hypothetical protein